MTAAPAVGTGAGHELSGRHTEGTPLPKARRDSIVVVGEAMRAATWRATHCAQRLTSTELRVLLAVANFTAAYTRLSDRVRLAALADAAGLLRPGGDYAHRREQERRVSAALQTLHELGVITYVGGRGRGEPGLVSLVVDDDRAAWAEPVNAGTPVPANDDGNAGRSGAECRSISGGMLVDPEPNAGTGVPPYRVPSSENPPSTARGRVDREGRTETAGSPPRGGVDQLIEEAIRVAAVSNVQRSIEAGVIVRARAGLEAHRAIGFRGRVEEVRARVVGDVEHPWTAEDVAGLVDEGYDGGRALNAWRQRRDERAAACSCVNGNRELSDGRCVRCEQCGA